MSTAAVAEEKAVCSCQLLIDDQIRLCRDCHRYWKGKREYTSVSRVIRTLIPTDYSTVPPSILETARVRGSLIDAWFSEYLRTGSVTVGSGEDQDARDRLDRLIDWWDKSGLEACSVQEIVHSDTDGIAATYDFATEDCFIDLKAVSRLQPNYALQLGCYAAYDSQKFPLRDVAILHLTKDRVKLVKYDAKKCKEQWKAACSWWKTLQELQ